MSKVNSTPNVTKVCSILVSTVSHFSTRLHQFLLSFSCFQFDLLRRHVDVVVMKRPKLCKLPCFILCLEQYSIGAPYGVATPGIFIWGLYPTSGMENPKWGPRRSPSKGLGVEVPQKLKEFADIVYRFWLQKRTKFEKFVEFTPDSWVLSPHAGNRLVKILDQSVSCMGR